MLSSLQKANDESIIDCIFKAETIISALCCAGETLGVVCLKGLPESYKPFALHIANLDYNVTFANFKTKFRCFEETENMRAADSSHSVMKIQGRVGQRLPKTKPPERRKHDTEITCFKWGTKGHLARECRQKVWCSRCRSDTHKDAMCRHKDKDSKDKRDRAYEVIQGDGDNDTDFVFMVWEGGTDIQGSGVMVEPLHTTHFEQKSRSPSRQTEPGAAGSHRQRPLLKFSWSKTEDSDARQL